MLLSLTALAFAAAADPAYSYSATAQGVERRDPFKSYPDGGVIVCWGEVPPPLTLKAIVRGTATPRALFEDATGKGESLRIGDRVNGDVITAILADRVVVTRETRTSTGARSRTAVPLFLHPEAATPVP